MLSARRPPLAVLIALVAAVLCVLGWPAAAMAAEVAAAELAGADRAGDERAGADRAGDDRAGDDGPDGVSWEPVASTCASDEPAALPPEPMCEIIAVDPDDDGFFAAAPMCDPSGTSAIAAEPVHPIGDDRLEAPPSACDGESLLRLDRRSQHDDPPPRLSVGVDPALLPVLPVTPRWWGVVTDVGASRLLGPAEGIRRRLEHPPHGA